MKKNIFLTLLLAVVSCLAGFAANFTKTDFTTDNVAYHILTDRDGCVEVATSYSYKGDLVIPATVKNAADGKEYTVVGVGYNAFGFTYGALKGVTLPNTVEYLADKAFNGASGLTSVVIADGVESIGESCFSGCSALPEFTVTEGNKWFSTDDGVLFDKSKSKLLLYPIAKEGDAYTIPDGVVEIGARAFENVSSLKTIALDESLSVIGDNAFSNCAKLETIDFTGLNIKSLGKSMFRSCQFIKELNFSASTFTTINSSTFYSNFALKKLWLPATVTEIGDYAFSGLKSLEELHMLAKAPAQFQSIDQSFDALNNELTVLYVPAGSKAAYEADPAYAGNFKDIVEEGSETAIRSLGTSAKTAVAVSNGQIVFGGNATDIHVFDMTGKEVCRQDGASAVDAAKLGKGVYVAKAVVDGKAVAAKVCIK